MKTIHDVKHIVTDFLSDPNLFTSKYDRRYQDDEEALKMKLLANHNLFLRASLP